MYVCVDEVVCLFIPNVYLCFNHTFFCDASQRTGLDLDLSSNSNVSTAAASRAKRALRALADKACGSKLIATGAMFEGIVGVLSGTGELNCTIRISADMYKCFYIGWDTKRSMSRHSGDMHVLYYLAPWHITWLRVTLINGISPDERAH